MNRKTRILAVLFAVVLFFILLGSALYIAAEENHDCTGRDCPVCQQLRVCEHNLQDGFLVGLAAVLAAGVHYRLGGNIPGGAQLEQERTLVTLKVKLSN